MTPSTQRVIRTPDQRLRVFVSSTLQELHEERKAAREAIAHLRLTPVMFELGARRNCSEQRVCCEKKPAQCSRWLNKQNMPVS